MTALQNPPRVLRVESLWQRGALDFIRSPLAMVGLLILLSITLAALFAPWITPQNPYDLMQLDVLDARLAPGAHSAVICIRRLSMACASACWWAWARP